uniref:Secreted protein n=1 Tax=Arundo donax TaxID=35708 RepID=A0A0A9CMG7_ARUDO
MACLTLKVIFWFVQQLCFSFHGWWEFCLSHNVRNSIGIFCMCSSLRGECCIRASMSRTCCTKIHFWCLFISIQFSAIVFAWGCI